ncbi:MAG TPA: thioesterase family protein [Burkholderiales bacterium]|nr:thioesterase family protein [Burkholderiales bacterium]
MAREDFRFVHSLRVRWAEVDRQGIVFNAHYLLYFDVGVTEYWRALGYPYPDALVAHGTDLYVKHARVEYHLPATYDDMLGVLVRVARIGRSSLRLLLEVHRGEQLLVNGELIYVNADPLARKSAPVPAFLRAAILGFERVAPELAP